MAIQDDLQTLLGNQPLTKGMTEEEKKSLLDFTSKQPESNGMGLLEKGPTSVPAGSLAEARRKATSSSSTSRKSATKVDTPETEESGVDGFTGAMRKAEADLTPTQKKAVAVEAKQTDAEIKQAAEDPSMFTKAANMLGIAGDFAANVFDTLGNPQDRVDWLRMATIYGLSRAAGNSTNFALMNGLLRGIESGERKQQAKALAERAMMEGQQEQANKDRDFALDQYKARSDRMKAEAAQQTANAKGNDAVGVLNSDERKVAESVADTVSADTAVVYEAANQLKKRNLPVTSAAVKKVVEQMRAKGYVSDDLFGTDKLQ